MRVLLASGSPRRSEILARAGYFIDIHVTDCDESTEETSPDFYVEELSSRKAMAVARELMTGAYHLPSRGEKSPEEILVVGADTVVALEEQILGKPKDEEEAVSMISSLAGRSHSVFTGVTLMVMEPVGDSYKISVSETYSEETKVHVKEMSAQEIQSYVAVGESMDKAGAYGIQGAFGAYIDHFEGSYHNVVGFPIESFMERARELGIFPVKLVLSDIDGTLVKDSSPEMVPEIFPLFEELLNRGIRCGIASGRQYESIRHLMKDQDELIYLGENGANIVVDGESIHSESMDDLKTKELLGRLREFEPPHGVIISTMNGSYLEHPTEAFETLIRDSYHNAYQVTDDFLKEGIPAIKIAIYHPDGMRETGECELIPAWKDTFKTCMAGEQWVDFMSPATDKGNGLRILIDYLGIEPEEVMVFGDQENDIGMFETAAYSYAVENAREAVKAKANYGCPAYTENGVCKTISEFLYPKKS